MYPNSFSKWKYYLCSIVVLLTKLPKPLRTIRVFLGLHNYYPFMLQVRKDLRFAVHNKMDMWVIKETCVDLEYERGFVEIQDGWTVVDIGAAFGDFCNSVATRCPNSSIVAFEPLPGSYQQLCENLASNDVQNVVALNCAVGEKTGRIRIQLPEGVYPGDFCLKDNQADDVEGAHEVECLALSDIFNKYFDRCDFLKIDCEGAEYDILLNAPKEIFSKIRYIAMEYHDFQGTPGHEALVEELKGHGFEVELRPSPVHAYLGLLLAKNTNY